MTLKEKIKANYAFLDGFFSYAMEQDDESDAMWMVLMQDTAERLIGLEKLWIGPGERVDNPFAGEDAHDLWTAYIHEGGKSGTGAE